MDQIFADGLGAISINSGVVRIEFCTQRKDPNAKGAADAKVVLVPSCAVNIPIEGFANMVPHLQGLVEKLEKDGVLKRQDAQKPSGSPTFN